jgi:hypothetical protein
MKKVLIVSRQSLSWDATDIARSRFLPASATLSWSMTPLHCKGWPRVRLYHSRAQAGSRPLRASRRRPPRLGDHTAPPQAQKLVGRFVLHARLGSEPANSICKTLVYDLPPARNMALATRAAAAALQLLLLAQWVADVRSDQRVVSSKVLSCLPGAPQPMAAAAGRRIQQNPDTLPTQPEDDIPLNVARPTDIKCFQKLSILIELAPEQQGAPATFKLRCIGSPVCPCPCNYLSDPGCGCRDLKSVLEIKVDHSAFTATFAADPTGELYTWNAEELVSPIAPGQSCTVRAKARVDACHVPAIKASHGDTLRRQHAGLWERFLLRLRAHAGERPPVA